MIITSRKYPKYLITDKGYVSIKNKNKLKNKIILVYGKKKKCNNLILNYYQKKKYKRLLKTRSINANFFSWLKQFKRIMVRYDRLTSTFKSFIFLAIFHIVSVKLDNMGLNIY